MIDPGTPFDWENPEAYRPPSEHTAEELISVMELSYLSMADHSGSDFTQAKDQRQPRWSKPSRVVRDLAGVAAICTILVPGAYDFSSRALSQADGLNCPTSSEPNPEYANDLDRAREAVANMEFGIEKDRYDSLKAELNQAQSRDEIQHVLQQAMDPYNVHVAYGDLPQAHIGLLHGPDPRGHHSVDLLTIDEARASTDKFLVGLSQIPASLLKHLDGFNMYLTHAPSFGDKDMGGGYLSGYTVVGRNIILDTSFPDRIAETFKHELTHVIHEDQCGLTTTEKQTTGSTDQDFVSHNGANFSYSTDRKKQYDAKDDGIVVSSYASTSYLEDVAEVGASILSGKSPDIATPKDIINAKQNLVSDRFALIEPAFNEYRHYLKYLDGRPFPKEIAKANSLTAECFDKPALSGPVASDQSKLKVVPVSYFATTDELPPKNYNFYAAPSNATNELVYRVGWHKPDGVEDDTAIRRQLGWNLLGELRENNEIPMKTVDYTVKDYADMYYGDYRVNCSAVSISK